MNFHHVVTDLTHRIRVSATSLPELDLSLPNHHPNSVGWLLWHTGREIDMQLSHLSGQQEVWHSQGFKNRFQLGEIGDSLGYGHTDEQARSIQIKDQEASIEYIVACTRAVDDYAATVSEWEDEVDVYDGESISRRVRVTSILIDALEHLAQAHYVAGMK